MLKLKASVFKKFLHVWDSDLDVFVKISSLIGASR
jgi:hypothetical protein